MPRATKTTTPKPTAKRATRKKEAPAPVHEHIAMRAYFIHLEEGGDPQSNWLRAERELVPA